jgi:hypothetical protein
MIIGTLEKITLKGLELAPVNVMTEDLYRYEPQWVGIQAGEEKGDCVDNNRACWDHRFELSIMTNKRKAKTDCLLVQDNKEKESKGIPNRPD